MENEFACSQLLSLPRLALPPFIAQTKTTSVCPQAFELQSLLSGSGGSNERGSGISGGSGTFPSACGSSSGGGGCSSSASASGGAHIGGSSSSTGVNSGAGLGSASTSPVNPDAQAANSASPPPQSGPAANPFARAAVAAVAGNEHAAAFAPYPRAVSASKHGPLNSLSTAQRLALSGGDLLQKEAEQHEYDKKKNERTSKAVTPLVTTVSLSLHLFLQRAAQVCATIGPPSRASRACPLAPSAHRERRFRSPPAARGG